MLTSRGYQKCYYELETQPNLAQMVCTLLGFAIVCVAPYPYDITLNQFEWQGVEP